MNKDQLAISPTIGIITALPKEHVAVDILLQNTRYFPVPRQRRKKKYKLGELLLPRGDRHYIVLALLTHTGTNMASIYATQLLNDFPSIQYILMVGIAGGIPYPEKPDEHVRLGDIVISDEYGIVQYDYGKKTTSQWISRPFPRPPSSDLLHSVKLLESDELKGERPWLKYIDQATSQLNVVRPSAETDILASSTDPNKIIAHPNDKKRFTGYPRIFRGPIAAANTLLRDPILRDELRNQYGVKAVEMESSGIADATWDWDNRAGYLAIRGICDYGDSNKNKIWQEYAAIVAAAYMRALLETFPSQGPSNDLSAKNNEYTDRVPFYQCNDLESSHDGELRELLNTFFLHRTDELKPQMALRESGKGGILHNLPTQVSQSLYNPPTDDIMLPITLDFVGREQDLDWLINTLKTERIAMLRGMGGIGKTTLASIAIKQLRKEGDYPDGVIVIDCKDLVDTDELMQKILAKLNIQNQPPYSLTIELVQEFMKGKKILILLDSIEPEMQLGRLIPPFYELGATILITARHPISPTIIPREVCYHLKALPLLEAMEVFSRAFGKRNIEELSSIDYEEVKAIVELLDRHTLAVKLAGSYANETGRELYTIAEELKDPQNAIALPDGENSKAVAKIFNQSLEKLPSEAKKLFFAIAGYSSLDIGRKSIIELARSLGIKEPGMMIDLLIRRSLLDTYNATSKNLKGDLERIRLHPLLFAIIRSGFSNWTNEETDLILDNILLYYLEYSSIKILKVIDLDLENIAHSLEWAYKNKQYRNVFRLSLNVHDNICTRRRDSYILKYIPMAIDASKNIMIEERDTKSIAIFEGMIALWIVYYASALRESHRLEEALTCANEALNLEQKLQDPRGLGMAYEELGHIEKELGHLDDSLSHFNNALSCRQNADQWPAVIEDILNIASLFQQQGRLEKAIDSYREAITLCGRGKNNERLISLKIEGYLSLSECMEIPEAKEKCIEQAITLALSLSNNFALQIYIKLGSRAILNEQLDKAKIYFDQALQLTSKSTKNSVMFQVYIGLLAIAQYQGRIEESMQYYKMILELTSGIEEDSIPNLAGLLSQLRKLESIK